MRKLILTFGFFLVFTLIQAHTCNPQKVECPMDHTKVEFCVTMSMTTFGSYYDFQKTGAVGNHYEELINSCSKCHFSGYLSDFEKEYSPEQKTKIKNFLVEYENVKIDEAKECEIAGNIKVLLKEKNDEISNCYLTGSYVIRFDSTQIDYRKQLQTKTLTFLKKAIENNEYDDASVIATINYLIGEMYRRTSDFEQAIIYYDLAILDENKQDWVEEIATKQKELAVQRDDDNNI